MMETGIGNLEKVVKEELVDKMPQSELNRLVECLETRAKLLLCEADGDNVANLLKEAKTLLKVYGFLPQQYVKFDKRMRPFVVTNVFDIGLIEFYQETYGMGVLNNE